MKNAVKIFCIILLATFAFACDLEPDDLTQPRPELEQLDLSDLDLQIEMDLDYYESIGYDDPNGLRELFGQVSKAIMSAEEFNFTTHLKVQKHQTRVAVSDDSTPPVLSKADWKKVGKGTCKNEACIANKVMEVSGNVPDNLGVGQCFEVRIHRVLLGAHVEWRVGDCG